MVLPGQTVWQEPMWTTRFTVSELRAQSRTFQRPWQLTLQALGSDASLGKCAVVVGGSAALACAKGGKVAGLVLGLWSAWGAYAYLFYGEMLRKGWKVGSATQRVPKASL